VYGDALRLEAVWHGRAARTVGFDCVIGAGPGPMPARMALRDARPGVTCAVPDDPGHRGVPRRQARHRAARRQRRDRPHPVRVRPRHLGRVAAAPPTTLQRLVGARAGREPHEKANGVDRGRVVPDAVSRSPATERTFDRDEPDPGRHHRALLSAAEELGTRLRAVDKVCRTLTLTVRHADISATTRSRTLPEPTAHSAALTKAAYGMYETLGLRCARVRAITLRAEGPAPAEQATPQPTFDPADE
jgi:nucleotidyltransferase/DNA polymerase involved in DNA repair